MRRVRYDPEIEEGNPEPVVCKAVGVSGYPVQEKEIHASIPYCADLWWSRHRAEADVERRIATPRLGYQAFLAHL